MLFVGLIDGLFVVWLFAACLLSVCWCVLIVCRLFVVCVAACLYDCSVSLFVCCLFVACLLFVCCFVVVRFLFECVLIVCVACY